MDPLRPRDPRAIGPYKLVGRLGAGGMGVVYIASKGSETVALKIIRDSIIDDPSQATRFIREIETLKSINSPHVAKVLDTGAHNERPWFTTEFVNGPDLKSHVTDKGPMPDKSWDALAKGLLDGLAAIHAAGIIHRDIKPANIILSESGPKIIDFGIAQVADATSVTSTGAIAGTPAWFSPEQIEGSEISTATDLFSAGSTLVYAATGKSPWGDVEATTKASVYKILLDEPDLSGLSEKQSRLVRPLLNKDASARSRDGKPSGETRPEDQSSSSKSRFQRLGQSSRRRKLVGSLAVILFAGIGGIALTTFAVPSSEEALDDGPELHSAAEVSVKPELVSSLGAEFFEEIASGIELASTQNGEQITFSLAGPGATYIQAAEVSLSDLPGEWTGTCETPVTLQKVPLGVAHWAGSCELSLPESGEAVPGAAEAIITFNDNDGEKFVASKTLTTTVETRPVPQATPPRQRLTVIPVDRESRADSATLSGSAYNERVFVQGETLVYCTWGGWEASYRERIEKGELTQALAMSPSGTVVVGTGAIELGSVDPLYQAGQSCPGFSWNGVIPETNSSERLEVSWSTMAPHARSDGSVFLRIIPPGGYGGPLEYVVSKG